MLGASLALAATPLAAATAIDDGSKAKTWDNIVSTNGILGFDGLGYIIRSSDLNFISYNGTKIGTFSIAATFATVFAGKKRNTIHSEVMLWWCNILRAIYVGNSENLGNLGNCEFIDIHCFFLDYSFSSQNYRLKISNFHQTDLVRICIQWLTQKLGWISHWVQVLECYRGWRIYPQETRKYLHRGRLL